MKALRSVLSDMKRSYLHSRRSKYFNKIREIVDGSPSIISNNCFAGRIYQDLEIPYTSPTAGLYMFFPDYIEFLSDLKNNLKEKITFVEKSKYEIGNQRLANHKYKYPIGLLNGKIEINFLHYHSIAEAEDKWYRRSERVDFNNLIVFGSEMDLCTKKDIEAFDKLNFEKKFFFTCRPYDIGSTIYLSEFNDKPVVGDPYEKGHVLYRGLCQKFGTHI